MRRALAPLCLAALLVGGTAAGAPPAGAARSRGGSGADTHAPARAPSTVSAGRRTLVVSGVTVRGRLRKPGVVVDLSREEARFSQGTAHLSPRDRRFLAPGERALPAPSRPRR